MSTRETKLLYLLALVTCAALCIGLGGCATAPTVSPSDNTVVSGPDTPPPVTQADVQHMQSVVIQDNIAREESISMAAEGTWLVLDAFDTAQTVQIAKHPNCYYEADPIAAMLYGSKHPSEGAVIGVNVAMAFAHTLVTSWLDDKVAEHEQSDPNGSLGGWYVARIAWHVLSLSYSGASVIHNYNMGITPTGVRSTCHG